MTLQHILRARRIHSRQHQHGFGLPELLIATSTGAVLLGASTLALRSTGSLINKMDTKASLQQNSTGGKRLMRSEIERSLHLLIATEQPPSEALAHTDLNHSDYASSLNQCRELAAESGSIFNPIFGLKMAELNEPVFYGLTVSGSGRGFAVHRCGAVMHLDGRYNTTNSRSIAPLINDIGSIRCPSDEPECEIDAETASIPLEQIAANTRFTFSDDKTPLRTSREPALRLMTDENRKLIRLIDPTGPEDKIETSFLKVETVSREITTQPFYFVAYARADRQITPDQDQAEVLNGLFFRNVSSKRMRFLVDGSGSMGACILWGSGYGHPRIYWGGRRYFWSRRSCALTRMESLQHELISLLSDLPEDTQISLRSFSSPGHQNHRIWADSARALVPLGRSGARESAIAFVNTLDDGHATTWGGTSPWEGLDEAFSDESADTLYFLSDGEPNHDRNGGRWTASDQRSIPEYYADLNSRRDVSLQVNTIALGLRSSWMQILASRTTGDYLQIDKTYVTSASQ